MYCKEHAKSRIIEHINTDISDGLERMIVDEITIEKSYGWIFFYNTKEYFETMETKYALAGNGPIIFKKDTGEIIQLATYKSVDEIISDYELENGLT